MMAKIIPLLRRILKDTEFEAIRLWLVNMDMNPRKKAFSGLFHMFTVSLGRVGYAAAPMQLSDEDYEKLDGLHCELDPVPLKCLPQYLGLTLFYSTLALAPAMRRDCRYALPYSSGKVRA